MNYEKCWFLTSISTHISIFLVICFFSKSFVLISNGYCVSQKEENQIIASFLLRDQKADSDHQDFMQYVYCMCACSVAQWCPTLQPYGLQSARLLCPWNVPGKNTGMGCHFLLQGIFGTQRSNLHLLCLLHW